MRLIAFALMLAFVAVPVSSATADLGATDRDPLDGICQDEHLRGREPWKSLCDAWESGATDIPDLSGLFDGICEDEHLRGREPWKSLCDAVEGGIVSTQTNAAISINDPINEMICDDYHVGTREPWKSICTAWNGVLALIASLTDVNDPIDYYICDDYHVGPREPWRSICTAWHEIKGAITAPAA